MDERTKFINKMKEYLIIIRNFTNALIQLFDLNQVKALGFHILGLRRLDRVHQKDLLFIADFLQEFVQPRQIKAISPLISLIC